jgi:hypothetical protein
MTDKLRRAFVAWLAAGPAIAVAGRALAEDGKARKVDMKYQDKPNGDQVCAACIHFQAPNKCEIVEGTISPAGWCIEYQKKT